MSDYPGSVFKPYCGDALWNALSDEDRKEIDDAMRAYAQCVTEKALLELRSKGSYLATLIYMRERCLWHQAWTKAMIQLSEEAILSPCPAGGPDGVQPGEPDQQGS